jgi:glycosyltransferase involved in cell wall biosynthesis
VDSGSSDDSCNFAISIGADVVMLNMELPFTAARARNEGFNRLRMLYPGIEYVQFVDGDCEVTADWIENAVTFLDLHQDTAVVCGRLHERYPERSIYNMLCDIEWQSPAGESKACGGNSLMRVDAFVTALGFNPSLIAGEEPELCLRMRAII